MSETDPKVMSLVEAALKDNPAVSVQDLYDMARKKKRSISSMSLRQFHARYPLQIKRKKGSGARRKARAAARTVSRRAVDATRRGMRRAPRESFLDRDAVRATLLGFASDLAAAHTRSDAVAVVASVDRYVDQIERAAV